MILEFTREMILTAVLSAVIGFTLASLSWPYLAPENDLNKLEARIEMLDERLNELYQKLQREKKECLKQSSDL